VSEPTLGGLLVRAAKSEKGVRFLDRREQASFHSYSDLLAGARRAAIELAARGVGRADRVAIVLPTGPEFYHAFFGAVLRGAVPVPLYPPVRLGRLREYHQRTAGMIGGCRSRIVLADRRVARVIGTTVAAARPPLGLVTMNELGSGSGAAGELPDEADPHAVALVQHSSGTTGRPRPVRLTHHAVLQNIGAIRRRLLAAYPDAEEGEHGAVSWLPLYHDMGLIGCVITALAHPADLTLIPPELFVSRPGSWLRTISRYRGTVSGAPDFAYSYCADRVTEEEMEGVDLSSWLVALNGAEPVTVDAMERFARRFERYGFRRSALTPVYGLAEATLAVTFSDPARPFRSVAVERDPLVRDGLVRPSKSGTVDLVSVGRPLDGVRVRIAPADGGWGEGRPDTVGRVLVSGPSLSDGYDDEASAVDPNATSGRDPEASEPRWIDTGDTGFMLDGALFVYSRAKDVIVLRGRKYAPQDIERALHGLDGVRPGCTAALGVPPEPGLAEQLAVLVERVRSRSDDLDDELAREVSSRVASRTELTCDAVTILDPGTLPRTSSGKIRRAEARRLYLAGELRPPGRADVVSLLGETVRSRIALARLRRDGPDRPGTSRP